MACGSAIDGHRRRHSRCVPAGRFKIMPLTPSSLSKTRDHYSRLIAIGIVTCLVSADCRSGKEFKLEVSRPRSDVGRTTLTLSETAVPGFVELSLSLKNETQNEVRFNLVESWMPLVVSSDGRVIEGDKIRDATRAACPEDFLILAPGKTNSVVISCTWKALESGILFSVSDRFGGDWIFPPLEKGSYSVCIIPCDGRQSPLFQDAIRRLGIEKADAIVDLPFSSWTHFVVQ